MEKEKEQPKEKWPYEFASFSLRLGSAVALGVHLSVHCVSFE